MWQNFYTFWNSINKLPKRLRILSLAALILFGINLAITYQLRQDISTQQQLIDNSFKPIRSVENLQYSHLQLAALIHNGSRHFNRRAYLKQLNEVEQQLQIVRKLISDAETMPANMPAAFHQTLQTYVAQWENIQPSLIRWGERPANNYLRQVLLVAANTRDETLGKLEQIAEDHSQEQRVNTENSTRFTLTQLTITSIIWSALLGMLAINILGFIRDQRRTETELLKAKNAADAANEAKSTFLSNMSHEMRTPMNAILNMTTFALDEAESAEQRDSLQMVKDSSEALLLLINNTLDISKIEAGALTLHVEPFNPRDLVDHITTLFTLQTRENGIQFKNDVDTNVPAMLLGDQNRIRQVLLNIVGNAVKFTPEGEVCISVSLQDTEFESPGQEENAAGEGHTGSRQVSLDQSNTDQPITDQPITLVWTIQDSGIGIPKEKHQSIFNAFEQVDNSSTRRYDGTGLGLTICKQLVDLMGGKIYLESEENRGTTFTITTPLALSNPHPLKPTDTEPASANMDQADMALEAQCNARKILPPYSPALGQIVTPTQLTNPRHRKSSRKNITKTYFANALTKRVLLVEDNLVNQKVTLIILQRAGYQVEIAHTGIEALQKLEDVEATNQPFDIILMDLQMPQMNGFDATKAIRAKEANTENHIPIIALTANAVNDIREECIQVGMDAYLTKPIQAAALLEAIQRLTFIQPKQSDMRV